MGSGSSIGAVVLVVHEGFPEQYQKAFEKYVMEGKTKDDALSLTLSQPAPTLLYINLVHLEHAIQNALLNNKTPLIIDSSPDDKVNTYFMYSSAVLFDGKKAGLDKSLRNIPVNTIMDQARNSLVQALKYGNTFVVALTKSVTDFTTTFNDETSPHPEGMCFPLEIFKNGGRNLLQDEYMKGLFRPQDREYGLALCRSPDTFRVVITSQFLEEDFEEYLFGNEWGLPKPTSQYQFIIIKDKVENSYFNTTSTPIATNISQTFLTNEIKEDDNVNTSNIQSR